MKKQLIGTIAAAAMLCAGVCTANADETTAPAEASVTEETTAVIAETTAAAEETTTAAEETTAAAEETTTAAEETTAAVEETTAAAEEPIAAEGSVKINISVSSEGKLAVVNEQVDVKDLDKDGAFTVNDALIAVHDAFYKGGAKEGYALSETQFGMSISKLWGVEHGFNYMYYINNAMAGGITDVLKDGDALYAYSFVDNDNCSDQFTAFDKTDFGTNDAGSEYTLTLTGAGFDSDWNLVWAPVADAVITIDGEKTEYTTDKDGKVTFKIGKAGKHVISAVSDSAILVPAAATAAERPAPTEVYVTISDRGTIAAALKEITVKDEDEDLMLTVNDALIAAHDELFEGGAKEGYATEYTQYGLSITKLWGEKNNGSFGYYVNHDFVYSLTTELKKGDVVAAYSYKDAATYSDVYTFFTVVNEKKERYQLNAITFDSNFEPVAVPVANAVITVDGKETKIKTDENGEFTLPKEKPGKYLLSAVSDEQIIVPPVGELEITEEETTGSTGTGKSGSSSKSGSNSGSSTTKKTDSASKNKTDAPNTGDRSMAAVAVTGLIALGALFAARRRDA